METSIKGILLGALLGTVAGSMYAAYSKNNLPGWTEKMRDIGENVFTNVKAFTEPAPNNSANLFTSGAVLGLFLGAASGLLLAPKTGKQLRKDLTRKYQNFAGKTQGIVKILYNHQMKHPLYR